MFKSQSVEGDGNCLFRTLAIFAFNDQTKWKDLKEMLGDFIHNDPTMFEIAFPDSSLAKYMSEFSKDGYWGGYIEMTAFAFLYNVKIVVHIKRTNSTYVIGKENDYDASVYHLKFENLHYEPLIDVFFDHFDPNEVF